MLFDYFCVSFLLKYVSIFLIAKQKWLVLGWVDITSGKKISKKDNHIDTLSSIHLLSTLIIKEYFQNIIIDVCMSYSVYLQTPGFSQERCYEIYYVMMFSIFCRLIYVACLLYETAKDLYTGIFLYIQFLFNVQSFNQSSLVALI